MDLDFLFLFTSFPFIPQNWNCFLSTTPCSSVPVLKRWWRITCLVRDAYVEWMQIIDAMVVANKVVDTHTSEWAVWWGWHGEYFVFMLKLSCVFKRMAFDDSWRKWILCVLHTTQMLSGFVSASGGLRQRDLVSPCRWIIPYWWLHVLGRMFFKEN